MLYGKKFLKMFGSESIHNFEKVLKSYCQVADILASSKVL